MFRALQELPDLLLAARAGEPTVESGLLQHPSGAQMLAQELPAFGPAVVHRALLAQLTHSASRIVSPATVPLLEAATDWSICPCAEHANDLRRADASTPRLVLPVASLIVDVAEGTRPIDPALLSEGFDLAAHGSGTLLVVDAVIADLRAWVRTDPRTASVLDARRAALHAATTAGDAEVVREVLASMGASGARWYQLTVDDHEALQDALRTGVRLRRHEVVVALLEAGVPTRTHAPSPLTELRAWQDEDVPLVQTLTYYGAAPEGNLWFEHPLHDATAKGWSGTVKALLARGGDVDGRNGDGQTALHLAAAGDHRDLVDLLLRFAASPLALDRAGNRPDEVASEANRAVLDAARRKVVAEPGRPPDRRPMNSVAVVDEALIVTAGRHDLYRWDVRDPARPMPLDHMHVDQQIVQAIVAGDRVVCIGRGSVRPLPDYMPDGIPPSHSVGVEVRELDGLALVRRVDVAGVCTGAAAAASPDGRLLAVGAQYALVVLDAVTLVQLADGDPAGEIEQVTALAFHPSGRHLVAITSDIYGGGASIDVLAVDVTARGVELGPQVTSLSAPNDSLQDERWYATRAVFDHAGTALYLFGGEGTGRGRIDRLDWSTDPDGAATLTPRWTTRGDDLLVLDDDNLLVQTEPLYLHVLNAADGSVGREIELDRPMPFPMLAIDATDRVWVVGHGGLTSTDALLH